MTLPTIVHQVLKPTGVCNMKDIQDAIIVHSSIALGAIIFALVAAKIFP
jgi:hypothetical protein